MSAPLSPPAQFRRPMPSTWVSPEGSVCPPSRLQRSVRSATTRVIVPVGTSIPKTASLTVIDFPPTVPLTVPLPVGGGGLLFPLSLPHAQTSRPSTIQRFMFPPCGEDVSVLALRSPRHQLHHGPSRALPLVHDGMD